MAVALQNWNYDFEHAFCTYHPLPDSAVSSATRERTYLFPLYLYPREQKVSLFDEHENTDAPGGRQLNLASEFIADIENKIGMKFIPDGKGNLGRPDTPVGLTQSENTLSPDNQPDKSVGPTGTFGPEDAITGNLS